LASGLRMKKRREMWQEVANEPQKNGTCSITHSTVTIPESGLNLLRILLRAARYEDTDSSTLAAY
jgi:hypothetical protein